MKNRIHRCGHAAKKGAWLNRDCPECLAFGNKKSQIISTFAPPPVEESITEASNWQPSDIITLNGTEYVAVATADAMIAMLDESLKDNCAKVEALSRIRGEVLRVKRVAKIYTTGASFLEVTFDFKDTTIRPGQNVSFYQTEE